jgi:hypothetical protein
MGEPCSMNYGMRNACKFWVTKPEGRRTLGGFVRRWDDNIKIDLKHGVRE